MAAQLTPLPCAHARAERRGPVTLHEGARESMRHAPTGYYVRQQGYCPECGECVVRVTALVQLGQWRTEIRVGRK
jgi:hypothetical protein